jgi:choline-sulfatase
MRGSGVLLKTGKWKTTGVISPKVPFDNFLENDNMNKPNILFIMTDQQANHMMSCAGNEHFETPAMDSLAKNGIRFENAYCSNPVCAPSRISMVTGMMSCRLNAHNNECIKEIEQIPLHVVDSSMGVAMKRAGYDTFYGGKVHLHSSLHPEITGFDTFFKDQREALPAACVDFIKQKRDNPFFAVASLINPHDICFAHKAKNGVDRHGILTLREQALALPESELPPLPVNYDITQDETTAVKKYLDSNAITPAITMRDEYDDYEWRINRWIYHRLTEQVDVLIGRILDGLKEAGLENETLIIFTSDHGNMDASHHLASKMVPYEESVKVPFIMQYKGNIPSGQVDEKHLVATGLDILATLYDYAGIDKPDHLLGTSLKPAAEGQNNDRCKYVASENDWFRMIRSRQYKYCTFASGGDMLFDLHGDPGELVNLAESPEHSDVLSQHWEMLREWSEISQDKDIDVFLK